MHANTNAYTLACVTTCIHMNMHGDSCMTGTDIQTDTHACLSTYIHTYMHRNVHIYIKQKFIYVCLDLY